MSSPEMVQVWQTDPAPGRLALRGLPDAARMPLGFRLDHHKPRQGVCAPGTAAFRYWVAAEALRRTADFWAPCLPDGRWHSGRVLKVTLNAGESFNALYDRARLRFFHGPSETAPHGTIYAGESPDIVCHEVGHAVLDVLQPALFHAAGPEFPAFHEAFGDVTAVLSALQLAELRRAVLAETGGDLTRSSALSRLGEQMGAAIRARAPEAVEPDCLRNAANRFVYRPPEALPASGPARLLSAEPHSLSRVFTGAMLDALARLAAPDEAGVLAASHLLRDLLAEAVGTARVVSRYFVEVAACLVEAAARRDAAMGAALAEVFEARGLRRAGVGEAVAPVALGHPAVAGRLVVPAAGAEAAGFVAGLFAGGRVALDGGGGRRHTHRLQADAGGARLQRCHFDCGLVHW